jgi:hypothetical protein
MAETMPVEIIAIYHNGMKLEEPLFAILDENLRCIDICSDCVQRIPRHLRSDGPMFERVVIIVNDDDNTRQLYTVSCPQVEQPLVLLVAKFIPKKILVEFYNY